MSLMAIRKERAEQVVSKISDDQKSVHVYGIPGMGKSEFLNTIQRRLSPEFDIIRVTVHLQDDPNVLYQDLLTHVHNEAPFLTSSRNKVTGLSAGFGPISFGGSYNDQKRSINKIEELLSDWGTPSLVVIVEDIDKLDQSDSVTRDIIKELDSVFSKEEVPVITSGEIGDTPIEEFHLNTFTEGQTREFLENKFPDPSGEDIRYLHRLVEGHPLYLKMIADSADTLENVDLPEEQVYDNIEELYLRNLSSEELGFLRRSAPLPQLDPDICSRVLEEFDKDQCTKLLESLANKVIVRNENRADRGYRVYHIHNLFRQVLLERLDNEDEIRRAAFVERASIISDILQEGTDEDVLHRISPHTMLASKHIESLYDSVTAEVVYNELSKSDLTVIGRGFISILILTTAGPDEVGKAAELTHNDFCEKLSEIEELNSTQKQLIISVSEYLVGKLDNNSIKDKSLTEISISGDMEELPDEDEFLESADLDISPKQQQKLLNSYTNLKYFFFRDEPYSKDKYRKLLEGTISNFGISPDLIIELAETCTSVLEKSDAGEELAELIESRFEDISEQIYKQSAGFSDFYLARDIGIDLGNEVVQEFLNKQVIEDGIIINMAIEGGEVLEKAENPIFAVIWYSLFSALVLDRDVDSSASEILLERQQKAIDRREEFEEKVSDPIIESADVAAEFPSDDEL